MLIVNTSKCGTCGACVGVCSQGALELVDKYLVLEKQCIGCKVCVNICPVGALCLVTDEEFKDIESEVVLEVRFYPKKEIKPNKANIIMSKIKEVNCKNRS